MDNALTTEPSPEEAARMQVEIARIFREIDDLRAQMQRDRSDIEKIKAETRALAQESSTLMDQLHSILASMRSAA